ncbi:hypothetical protein PFISCL1PPCAC_15812, partial [Pristionchus fissidentatus]
SHTVSLASLLLLVLVPLSITAQDFRLAPIQFRPSVSDRLSIVNEKTTSEVNVQFRVKQIRPCECLNGGHCLTRLRRCDCPLGFSGSLCEIVDFPLLSATNDAPESGPVTSGQQQMEKKQILLVAVRPPFNLTDWLFYVPLFVAILLLFTLIRVVVILSKSYLSEKKLPVKVTVVAQPLPDTKNENIYTLPLPVQPPPYSEKAAPFSTGPAHFVHSTPFRGNFDKEEESEYLCVNRLDEYAI